jgi:hypothetical protein
MSIRLPLKTVLDVTHTNQGTTSTIGGWAYPFKLPQDTDNVIVKMTASVVAGGMSATLQTSDDGGTTYYDVARTSVVSNAGATAVTGANAEWISVGTISNGLRTGVTRAASILTTGIGAVATSTLGSGEVSGLPIIGLQNRIFLQSVGNATAISTRIKVSVNNQSATA